MFAISPFTSDALDDFHVSAQTGISCQPPFAESCFLRRVTLSALADASSGPGKLKPPLWVRGLQFRVSNQICCGAESPAGYTADPDAT